MRRLALLALLPFFFPASRAAESLETCTGFIDTVPATVGTQGTWCLRHDVASNLATGNLIQVNANNVTIDCNGFKVGGLGAGPDTDAYGIVASGRSNTTVRGCNVRGFRVGISLGGSGGGHVVEDNRVESSTETAIHVEGDGSSIRRNLVVDTGAASVQSHGIVAVYTVDVMDNTIYGVTGDPNAIGIGTVLGHGSIAGNRIGGLTGDVVYGISIGPYARNIVRSNDIVGPGIGTSLGIACGNVAVTTLDNVISGFETSHSSCTSSGDVVNVAVP